MQKHGPASCARPRRAAAGTARPESSRVPAGRNFKAAGRWKGRGPPTALLGRQAPLARGPGAPPHGGDCAARPAGSWAPPVALGHSGEERQRRGEKKGEEIKLK